MVFVVVRAAPAVSGADNVPLVGFAVEFRIVHKIVLTVNYVVAQFHVLEYFRDGQQKGAEDPEGRKDA